MIIELKSEKAILNAAKNREAPMKKLELETNIPYQINRLAFRMNRRLERSLRKHDLSISNWRIMSVLNFNSTATVNELSDYAMIEQSTLSRMLQRMEKDGLLSIRAASDDARVREIQLSTVGREKFMAVRDIIFEHIDRILAGVSDDEKAALLSLILKLQHNASS